MAELIWDGKYDVHGNKRAPVRIELPFQTVETVNESVQERQRTLELSSSGHDPEWRNRLIWGDKKYVLPSLLPEFAGKVDLIYIDPPFDTGADFSFKTTLPESDAVLEKEPSVLEQKAYRDTWGVNASDRDRGITSIDIYSRWFYEALVMLRDLLSETASIYVHWTKYLGMIFSATRSSGKRSEYPKHRAPVSGMFTTYCCSTANQIAFRSLRCLWSTR